MTILIITHEHIYGLEISALGRVFKKKKSRELPDGQIEDDRYRVIDDIIYYNKRIYLIPESTLKKKII